MEGRSFPSQLGTKGEILPKPWPGFVAQLCLLFLRAYNSSPFNYCVAEKEAQSRGSSNL